MPVLARFERELSDEPFVVIGVHSPKFPNERDPGMVRDAVRRYSIQHPVIVDSRFAVWQAYGISAWPTLVLVDPEGYVIGHQPGEPPAEPFLEVIHKLLDEHRAKGTLDGTPLPLDVPAPSEGALSYPGKVLRDAARDRLFVADTGNNRVLELSGTDAAGAGPRVRTFDGLTHPNGMALADNTLYVADTGAHAVAAIDLATGETKTVAGTGEKGTTVSGGGPATAQALRSPWDLAWDERRGLVYIAMAGSHQLWWYSPAEGTADVLAGSGREARIDGPNLMAGFAQPSGIALVGDRLYVADSEISAIREVSDLGDRRQVRTVCGGDLFDFGDQDGTGDEVRLQHPIGICGAPGGGLLVADTYNHKVKRVDPATGRCTTLLGNGRPWRAPEETELPASASDQTPLFYEPEGIDADDGSMWIADTNNHRVLRIEHGSRAISIAYGN